MDSFILNCPSYKMYLDSFRTLADNRYLNNVFIERQIVALNYRSTMEIYTKEQFLNRKRNAQHTFFRKIEKKILFSADFQSSDRVLSELAIRETLHQQKLLSTIIYLHTSNRKGKELSGFIDVADSMSKAHLNRENCIDWRAVFEERVLLRPRSTDLSYYNWSTGHITYNNTENYAVLHDLKGLTFMHRGDRKRLCVTDSSEQMKRNNYDHSVYSSKTYGFVIFFDHLTKKNV